MRNPFLQGRAASRSPKSARRWRGEDDDATLNDFRDQVTPHRRIGRSLVAERTPELDALDARIAVLGPAPAKGAPAERSGHRRRSARRSSKQRAALDAEIKRAKMLSVESQQLFGDIAEKRRDRISRRACPSERARR